jgi:hypothetical protein
MSIEEQIKAAVERAAAMPAMHRRSVSVVEATHGEVLWQVTVEVFALPSAYPSTAYGWALNHNGTIECVAMLGIGSINSPKEAVRAWIEFNKRK